GLDRIARRLAVAAVADVPREAPLTRLLERADRVTPPELGERAAVELDEVEVVGREAAQAALDAGEERGGPPVLARPAAGVAALGEQVALAPPPADGPADEGLAVLVALGRVNHVEAGVQRAAEEPYDRAAAHALVTDLRAPEAEDARHHVGLAEPAPIHTSRRLDPGRQGRQ